MAAGQCERGRSGKADSLAEKLKADAPAKQIAVTTGFSTGFNAPNAQMQYYAAAFSNMADFRARDGANSPFIGIFYRSACDSADAAAAPPSADTQANMAKWDWAAKSPDIAKAMSNGAGSDEIGWWLKTVEGGLGMLRSNKDQAGAITYVPKVAQQALAQIATSVAEVNAQAASGAASSTGGASTGSASSGSDPWASDNTTIISGTTTATPGISGGSGVSVGYAEDLGTAIKGKVKEGLLGILDKVFTKIGDKIANVGSGSGGGSGGGDVGGHHRPRPRLRPTTPGQPARPRPALVTTATTGTTGTTTGTSSDIWGNSGTSGSTGTAGYTGSTGTTGSTGSTGSTGTSGSLGDHWLNGNNRRFGDHRNYWDDRDHHGHIGKQRPVGNRRWDIERRRRDRHSAVSPTRRGRYQLQPNEPQGQ